MQGEAGRPGNEVLSQAKREKLAAEEIARVHAAQAEVNKATSLKDDWARGTEPGVVPNFAEGTGKTQIHKAKAESASILDGLDAAAYWGAEERTKVEDMRPLLDQERSVRAREEAEKLWAGDTKEIDITALQAQEKSVASRNKKSQPAVRTLQEAGRIISREATPEEIEGSKSELAKLRKDFDFPAKPEFKAKPAVKKAAFVEDLDGGIDRRAAIATAAYVEALKQVNPSFRASSDEVVLNSKLPLLARVTARLTGKGRKLAQLEAAWKEASAALAQQTDRLVEESDIIGEEDITSIDGIDYKALKARSADDQVRAGFKP